MIKKTYEAPELEMLEVVVEQGFALSGETAGAWTDSSEEDYSQNDDSLFK